MSGDSKSISGGDSVRNTPGIQGKQLKKGPEVVNDTASTLLSSLPESVATAVGKFMLKSPALKNLSPEVRKKLNEAKRDRLAKGLNIVSVDDTKGQGLNELS